MSPIAMALVMSSLLGFFAWSAYRRLTLLLVGKKTAEDRFSPAEERVKVVWVYAFFQKKMRYYLTAGLAHNLIFVGFLILLLRTLILWGRGFFPGFNLLILGPEGFAGLPLGHIYGFLKDIFAVLVLLGTSVFIYYRTIRKQRRMTLSTEGLIILLIIATMMISDIFYDGAAAVLASHISGICQNSPDWCQAASTVVAPYEPGLPVAWHFFPEPAGSLAAVLLESLSAPALICIAHTGFWLHSTLVLVFLNILPYSKHFHIITGIPNVYLSDLTAPGRLRPIAASTEALMEQVEKAMDAPDMGQVPIGVGRIEHFSWKDVLDFYTCTECGRCSDHCPAHTTGKKLSPKQLTIDLRNHLYERQDEFKEKLAEIPRWDEKAGVLSPSPSSDEESGYHGQDLVSAVVDPDVLWACTTCRACEDQCPVMISYVDKIVQMRRNLVVMRGEFPAELNKPFEGMEVNGNPWNLTRIDRATWTEGLNIPSVAERSDAKVLYWVGCAASYDDRAKKIARATAQLLQSAGVDFAILAEEESCTGDPARRAGNEYLFTMLAEANIETIKGYQASGGLRTIITTCPHCFNTLANEYPDFGGFFEVVHHADYLAGLVAEKRLIPTKEVKSKIVYHDSCYLGRYNEIYDSPRELLAKIPGVTLVEAEQSRNKGLCCGAGGAQMFLEEQTADRINVKRTGQLLDTGADTLASACPFCMTMLTDGLKAKEQESKIRQLDIAELLAESCLSTESESSSAAE